MTYQRKDASNKKNGENGIVQARLRNRNTATPARAMQARTAAGAERGVGVTFINAADTVLTAPLFT